MRVCFLFLIMMLFQSVSYCQEWRRVDTIPNFRLGLSMEGGVTFNKRVPYWLRSNQYGSVPSDGISGSIQGSIFRDYRNPDRLFDWGAGIDGRLNVGNNTRFILVEGYVKGRLDVFQIKAGRFRWRDGLTDSSLGSGSFSLSGNAPGIPSIEISMPDYWSVPFTNGIVAIKGEGTHGWMGDQPIQYGAMRGKSVKTYFHHASVYGRIGKPEWRLKFYGALNHDVIWGSDKQIFQEQYNLSTPEAFFYVVTGKKYKGVKDISKIGNHLGSIDIKGEYEFDKVKLSVYHQFFYEKGAIAYLANILDGLTGIAIERMAEEDTPFSWSKILFEIFYSKNQAGEEGAKYTPSGPEYYYNHAVYTNGYSYEGFSLGNPLITAQHDARKGQASNPYNYFINNRVLALHFGLEGTCAQWNYRVKATFSRNWGDYRTSGVDSQWFNGSKEPQTFPYGIFKPVNQFSGYFEASRALKNGFRVGVVLAGDYGDLLYNTAGGFIKLSKSW